MRICHNGEISEGGNAGGGNVSGENDVVPLV